MTPEEKKLVEQVKAIALDLRTKIDQRRTKSGVNIERDIVAAMKSTFVDDHVFVDVTLAKKALSDALDHNTVLTLIAALEAAVERVGELERQNEVDRQLVSIVSADLMRTINGRDWMSEGRGPYKWNDDDYQREFGDACSEIRQSIALIKHVANSWDDCPREQEIWQACRAKAQELFEELRDRKALETKL